MSIRYTTTYQRAFWLSALVVLSLAILVSQGCNSTTPLVTQSPHPSGNPSHTLQPKPSLPVVASQGCDSATQLVSQSYDYGSQGRTHEEKLLLNNALQSCPTHAEAHNNLAAILEDEGNYEQAIDHYKQALQTKPHFSQAWYGLGETYYKQGQFPLSLEAHLQACQTDNDSKQRVKELLTENRYAVTEEGQILNKESLLLLYDKQRREKINRMISECGLRASGTAKGTFRNVTFHAGSAELTTAATQQVKNLAAAFKTIPNVIKVHGHTDSQPFQGVTSQVENERLNLKLSQQRADAVKRELVARGLPAKRIQTRGYGSTKPLVPGNSEAAWAKNRRVEIESID
jgi:outer membrane protein OmpA-like peptidoglycan-associated protein